MATGRRETKKHINRLKIVRIEVTALFLFLILVGLVIGLIIGKVTNKPTIETVYQTVEVPSYQKDELPGDTEVYYFDVPLSHSLQNFIYEICADEKVPVALVMAMIEHESGFDPEVVSDTADCGLMQINEINYEWLEEEYRCADMTNPYQNVFCGVKIIGQLIEKYEGDYGKALMCYNMGEYGAKKAWNNGIDSSSYSRKILNLYEKYEEVSSNAANANNE